MKVYVIVRTETNDCVSGNTWMKSGEEMYGYCGVASSMKGAKKLLKEYIEENYEFENEKNYEEDFDEVKNLYEILVEEIGEEE